MTSQDAVQDKQDIYFAYRDIFQEVFYRILTRSGYSMEARLFSLLSFALAAGSFYYPETEEFTEEKLAREIDKVAENVYENLWLQNFQDYRVDLTLPMSMIQSTLLGNLQEMHPGFKELLQSAWSVYADGSDTTRIMQLAYSGNKATLDCGAISEAYRNCRERAGRHFSSGIEKYIENYCTHFVFAETYENDVSLFGYAQRLILHVALLKYVVFSHPRIEEIVKECERSEGGERMDQEAFVLDETVLQIMQDFTIGLAFNEEPLLLLRQEMKRQKMNDMAHTVMFVLF